jgi:hypothetical protein
VETGNNNMTTLGNHNLGIIILGPIEIDIGFKLLCKKFGAGAFFSNPIKTLKDININFPMIANVQSKASDLPKIIKELEKNKNVEGILIPENQIKKAKSKLPILVESNEEISCDIRITEIPKKSKTQLILHKEFKDAEEAYDVFRNKQAECVMISETATKNPIFFEQLINYIEKGYYNKITRKRREKLVYEYQELCKKNKLEIKQETIQMILKE